MEERGRSSTHRSGNEESDSLVALLHKTIFLAATCAVNARRAAPECRVPQPLGPCAPSP
jgi:hypothetical protein